MVVCRSYQYRAEACQESQSESQGLVPQVPAAQTRPDQSQSQDYVSGETRYRGVLHQPHALRLVVKQV
jgi:hypothetical protein